MQILTITVTNNPLPDCQRMKLTKHFEIGDIANPVPFVRECVKNTEDMFRQIFPRGMTYTVPYTMAEVNEVDETIERRLLREAFQSGQLQGTIIGSRIQAFFGGASDTDDKLAPSEEDAVTDRMDLSARRRADAKAGRDTSYVVDER